MKNFFKQDEDTQREYIRSMHHDERTSISEIAKNLNTYPNRIKRLAKKLGITTKSRGEVQSDQLATGKRKNPTKGRKRTREERDLMALKRSEAWTDEEKERARQRGIERWKNLSDKERAEMLEKAQKGVLSSAKKGSKLENFLMEIFEDNGQVCIMHDKHSIADLKVELDLLLPNIMLAIEVDGPCHQKVVWTQEALEKKQKSDIKKNGLLAENGFRLIRIKYNCELSRADMLRISRRLKDYMDKDLDYQEFTYDKNEESRKRNKAKERVKNTKAKHGLS